jgi:hypothetical protein
MRQKSRGTVLSLYLEKGELERKNESVLEMSDEMWDVSGLSLHRFVHM